MDCKLIVSLSVTIPTIATASADEKPNILWVVSEDNTTFIGCYGDKFASTPTIDSLANQGVIYSNAFATAPVSSPSRSTLISGVYPTSLGTQNMRSSNPIPQNISMFVEYLQREGYYCANNSKTDYNSSSCSGDKWDASSSNAWWSGRKEGQPFFQVCNFETTHESRIFQFADRYTLDPNSLTLPPYLPDTPGNRTDRACYYNQISIMDSEIGKVLKKLEEDGLSDNTIIFYYADNGGVLGRSKRFLYEDGLHIPLVVYFPEKYKHLLPVETGEATDRLVSFIDFVPTVLSILGIEIPEYMQGSPFLGEHAEKPRDYIYAFRDRMDERYDLSRVVRDKKYKYIRNYMPHRPWGQHLNYLWTARGMQEWNEAYINGECNEIQAQFFGLKPAEELYDIENDPYEINNLANNEAYSSTLNRMRKEHKKWLLETKDSGFLTEFEMMSRSKGSTIYDLLRDGSIPYKKIYESADMASLADPKDFAKIKRLLSDSDAIVRYWATVWCINQPNGAKEVVNDLKRMAKEDESMIVRISAAEALYHQNQKSATTEAILEVIDSNDNEFIRLFAFNVVDMLEDEVATPIRKKAIDLYQNSNRSGYDTRIILYWKSLYN